MLHSVLSITNMVGKLVWVWLRVIILGLEIGYLIQWFLNINPYFEPVMTLWNWTDLVLTFMKLLSKSYWNGFCSNFQL